MPGFSRPSGWSTNTSVMERRKTGPRGEAKGSLKVDEEVPCWRNRKRRKPPGTSLGTGAMSHLSYYSHSPQPDLRQTNNLSPTAATVATKPPSVSFVSLSLSLYLSLSFSLFVSLRHSLTRYWRPSSFFLLFIILSCSNGIRVGSLCACTRQRAAFLPRRHDTVEPFSFTAARATVPTIYVNVN